VYGKVEKEEKEREKIKSNRNPPYAKKQLPQKLLLSENSECSEATDFTSRSL
jgi:hypothetical protein